MKEQFSFTVDAGDLIALVQRRYKVTLQVNASMTAGDGNVYYAVDGAPEALGKLYGAIKRAHKPVKPRAPQAVQEKLL
jgi:hypothetical protein